MKRFLKRAVRSTMFWLIIIVAGLAILRAFYPLGGFDEIRTGASPLEVGATDDGIWVLNYDDQSVSLINPDTEKKVFTTDVDLVGAAMAVNDDGAWLLRDAG